MAYDAEHNEHPAYNLIRLADVLDNLKEDELYDQGTIHQVEPSCGTSACALGWAAVYEIAGLSWKKGSVWLGDRPLLSLQTGGSLFGLTPHESVLAFGASYDTRKFYGTRAERPTAQNVAQKLREVAAVKIGAS